MFERPLRIAAASLALCATASCGSSQVDPRLLKLTPPQIVAPETARAAGESLLNLPADHPLRVYTEAAAIDRNLYIQLYNALAEQSD